MPMLTPTLTCAQVPATQPLTSVRVHASMNTRSRWSSVDILCMRWLVYRSPAPCKVDNGLIEPSCQRKVKQLNVGSNATVAQPLQILPGGFDHGNHQHPMSASNEARTDANDAHQCTNDMLAWTLMLVHHPHDLPNLAALHGDVN